jgi:hypothetical protein
VDTQLIEETWQCVVLEGFHKEWETFKRGEAQPDGYVEIYSFERSGDRMAWEILPTARIIAYGKCITHVLIERQDMPRAFGSGSVTVWTYLVKDRIYTRVVG